mmetsp:Transcript_99554/g.136800  ORF Transcript_99554/g.136800 Transcript_99554/m.136800 type:complete len:141 (+) Transcript_99554:474-896(+)
MAIQGICLMFTMLLALASRFPALGILFETIWISKRDMLYFTLLVILLVMGAQSIGYSVFGAQTNLFQNMALSILTLLEMMNGFFYYDEMYEANPQISAVYFLIFVLYFCVFVRSMYTAIVIRNYNRLRQRKLLITEAMAS